MSNFQEETQAPVEAEKHVLYWFRRGLRLHDNPALYEALKNCKTFRCIYILDPWFAGSSQVAVNKWRFLLHSLEDLDISLRKLNSRLFVVRGQPANVLPQLFKDWGINVLAFEEEHEPFGRSRDEVVCKMAESDGVQTITRISHTLYDPAKICAKNGGKAPLTYKKFQKVVEQMGLPEQPVPAPSLDYLNGAVTPVGSQHDEQYGVPTLEELHFDTESLGPAVWQGGETEALSRLDRHLERKAWVASFEKPKMTVHSLFPSSTGLSPYLRFGCLSSRLFYWRLSELYRKVKKQACPMSLHGQLLWREFFYTVASQNPNFDRMVGNPVCVQIPWDRNPEALAKWAEGKTGFPWIDAIMTQLSQEGWIHHLARHAVACFLTRGDLWISWEEGAKVFDELLLDADWSLNSGSWLWLSCSSFFQHFFHTYCPINFGKRMDPDGDYIRKYLPVLQGFPAKYIYEPWRAPIHIQAAAKCMIGQDYPVPMVDHAEVSRVNMARMKQVYQHLAGILGGSSKLRKLLGLKHPMGSDPYFKAKGLQGSLMSDMTDEKFGLHMPRKRKFSNSAADEEEEMDTSLKQPSLVHQSHSIPSTSFFDDINTI